MKLQCPKYPGNDAAVQGRRTVRIMPTPTKRQKRNDYIPSQQPVRSLDFFFNKQKRGQELRLQEDNVSANKPSIVTPEGQELDYSLTDEELARKLQEEWNNENLEGGVGLEGSSVSAKPSSPPEEIEEPANGKNPLDLEVTQSNSSTKLTATSSAGKINTLSLQSASSTEDTITTSIPFDEHPLTFNPSKYIPQLKEHWAIHGGSASYGLLTRAFVLINSTQSRIKIVDTLVNFLRTIIEGDPDSLLSAVSLSSRIYNGCLAESLRCG